MGLTCDSDHSTASSTDDSSGSGELIDGGAQSVDEGADSVEGPHRAEWMVLSIAGGAGVFVVVVLVITAVLVAVCIQRLLIVEIFSLPDQCEVIMQIVFLANNPSQSF